MSYDKPVGGRYKFLSKHKLIKKSPAKLLGQPNGGKPKALFHPSFKWTSGDASRPAAAPSAPELAASAGWPPLPSLPAPPLDAGKRRTFPSKTAGGGAAALHARRVYALGAEGPAGAASPSSWPDSYDSGASRGATPPVRADRPADYAALRVTFTCGTPDNADATSSVVVSSDSAVEQTATGAKASAAPSPGCDYIVSNGGYALRRASRHGSSTSEKRFASSTYCLPYQAAGRCRFGAKCHRRHDPKNVAACVDFAKARCARTDCPLQHCKRHDLMPVCDDYLRMRCFDCDCALLHVKHADAAAVCKPFQYGQCRKAELCHRRHVHIDARPAPHARSQRAAAAVVQAPAAA